MSKKKIESDANEVSRLETNRNQNQVELQNMINRIRALDPLYMR